MDNLNIPPTPEERAAMNRTTPTYVVKNKSWFHGFLQALAAFLVGSIITGFVSVFLFFIVVGSFAALSDTPTVVKDNSVLRISLSGTLEERVEDNPFSSLLSNSAMEEQSLEDILAAIKVAKTDDKINGIYLEAGMMSGDYASIEEIRSALSDFSSTGKFILAYGDNYTQGAYYVASIADKVMLNPSGLVEWTGIAAQPMFYKDLLEKLGVKMQVFRVGTYKSAVEPYIATEMSPANREQTLSYINSIWANLVSDVAESRNLTPEKLNELADNYISFEDADKAVEAGLIDTLVYSNGMRDVLRQANGNAKVNFISPAELAKLNKIQASAQKQEVAVYYAFGEIVDEAAVGFGAGSAEIVGNKVVEDLDKLMNDDNVKAVVLRINSPGGSAYASEQMWNAIEALKQKKPVVVSMGGVAASGGYYMSCNANKIYADATTITGSIGIFGLVPNFSGLLTDKLGLRFDVVKTNNSADFGSLSRGFNAAESKVLQARIERGYDLFLTRVADGRGMTKEEVNKIAQGRVWTGEQALGIGLVDELGTLDAAIQHAASMAALDNNYKVANYPAANNIFEQMTNTVKEDYMERELKSMLGEHYHHLKFVKQAGNKPNIYARIPYEINLQ